METNENNRLQIRAWGTGESVEHPDGGHAWLRPPLLSEIGHLHGLLHAEISPKTGSLATMMEVFAHNRDSLWLIEHLPPGSERPCIAGFYSFLPLNAAGKRALEEGTLDRHAPSLSLLAPHGEAPAALYIWAIVARGLLRRLMPLIARALGAPLYGNAPIFAFVATEDGRKAGLSTGFAPAGSAGEIRVGNLMQLRPWSEGVPA